MEELMLDLRKDATRRAIFAALVIPQEDGPRARVGQVTGDSSIPAQAQLHDLADVERAIKSSVASDWAKEQALEIYRILAQAEAKVHGCSVEQTHFHEVGKGMTVREILGMCTAVEGLGRPRLVSTKIQVGSGKVTCEHGELDIPAPATAAIIEEYGIPVAVRKLDGELCTPTSAAFIAHFVKSFV